MGLQNEVPDNVAEGTPLIGVPASMPKVQRTWRNSWVMLFGDGSPTDVAACCLAYHAPCVAFGWNHSRGLQLSFWRELLRFLLFTLGAFIFIKVACCAVVMLSCPPPPEFGGMNRPEPMGDPLGGNNWYTETTTSGVATPRSGGMMGNGGVMPTSGSASGVMPGNPGMMDAKSAVATASAQTQPHPDPWIMRGQQGGPFGHPHPHPHPDPMMIMMRDPECARRAVPGMVVVLLLGSAMVAYLVYVAARRRQAIRERFGIEGSFAKDCWLWACCQLCALSQETRTLMHEQVHEGVWYGAVPSAPPANQCMAV